MQATEIKTRLKSLIEKASTVDRNLARRLDELNRWIKNVKPGLLTAKPLVSLFLLQIIQDADTWLILQSMPSENEQQAALNALSPALRYWYSSLFPKWLHENDPKFYLWRQKLMAGEFGQKDDTLILSVISEIQKRNGNIVRRYIADLSMATDIIVSGNQEKPLCVQLTSLSDEHSQYKSDEWEATLRFWAIDRGIFLSYNPAANNYVNQIVNVILYNSNNLPNTIYLKFNL
ncbi:MAG: hypothetical protein IGS39_23650 [Calothrix sp. C42_A2020_038]|nr:hypothetical protein [Calothrix sp. C42_A2020_038]